MRPTDPALRQLLVTIAENTNPPADTTEDPLATASTTLDQIKQLGIPIGWQNAPQTTTDWALKFFGLLISIVAIAQGAPFWFDLLNKLINLRLAGQKPDKAPPASGSPTVVAAAAAVAVPPQQLGEGRI